MFIVLVACVHISDNEFIDSDDDKRVDVDETGVQHRVEEHVEEERRIGERDDGERRSERHVLRSRLEGDGAALPVRLAEQEGDCVAQSKAEQRQRRRAEPQLPAGEDEFRVEESGQDKVEDDKDHGDNQTDLYNTK